MIVAAVQARMGSSRLPGKILQDIVGKPMLWHIVNRLKACRLVDRVVIATSETAANDPVREFAAAHGFECFSGGESNVVDRLYRVCRQYGAEALVRVTGDCPFVDPEIVDQLIEMYLQSHGDVDYVCNVLPATFPHGLDAEVYPLPTLETLWRECANHPFWQDWFAGWLLDHTDLFRIKNLRYREDLSHRYRWTVDYPEDIEFARQVYGRLYRDGQVFHMRDVLDLLEREPGLNEMNSMHRRMTREGGVRIAYEAWLRCQDSATNTGDSTSAQTPAKPSHEHR
jgi:spore coat polysaccharide biosynthesis protein SpsF (cytidylyltransferase family)